MFVSNLYANAASAPAGAGGIIAQLMPLILIVVVFYFLLIRPQKKRQQQHKTMISALKVGDEVITNAGIVGKISAVLEDDIKLTVAEGVEITMRKNAVATLAEIENKAKSKK